MALLLNIDTATEHASVCLSDDGNVLALEKSSDQKNHASFIQPAIKKIFSEANIEFNSIDAIAVSAGPGSYTGLRVGLSSAKGLCYALHKPLILINTLEVMAKAAIDAQTNIENEILFCPMIDARRMEVFTALYTKDLKSILSPRALIINETTFVEYADRNKIIFSGSGSAKLEKIFTHANAEFVDVQHNASHLGMLAATAFNKKKFTDVAYSEPVYLKEFFTPQQRV